MAARLHVIQPQRRRTRALAYAVAVFGFPAILTAQSATGIFLGDSGTPPVAVPAGASTIRGPIFAADGGRPVRSARVQVSGAALPTARVTMTDASGAYEFRNLPAGRFTLSATTPAFIGLSYGQTRAFEAGCDCPAAHPGRPGPITGVPLPPDPTNVVYRPLTKARRGRWPLMAGIRASSKTACVALPT